MSIIIGLIILGFILISFEIIVPGGVLGILGSIMLLAACAKSYQDYGFMAASLLFVALAIFLIVGLYLELKFLPKTRLGQKMFLNQSNTGHSGVDLFSEDLIGKEGKTVTKLSPTGRIAIEDQEYEAFSEDGLIDKDVSVKVMKKDTFKLFVRKI